METEYTIYRDGCTPPECNEWFGIVKNIEYNKFKVLAKNINIEFRSSSIYDGNYYSIFCRTTDDVQILQIAYFEECDK